MKKYITKQSSIKGAGKGLFTNTSFKKGELIGLAHVNGQPTKEVGSNHNHNEKNPTAYSKKINNKRFIYASKNLKPGEEITTNYRMQPELEQPEDFMREGGSLLTKKVTCKSCGWKWDAEDGGKDITTCHKCGGQGLIHAQKGGNKDAMTGMMKARLAYANEFGNPAAERMINLPDNPYQFDNGDTGSHYMASMDNYAVPQIQDENGVLQLGDYGPESNEAIRFDSDEDANYFAENYKDVSPGFIEADLNEDEIEEYRRGGYIVEEIDTFQNGGVYTVKGSDGVYKKVNGKWQVDWNKSGKYQPLSKGDVKARTAVLDKMAKPLYDKDYDEMVAYKNLSTKDKINKFIPKKEATKEELKKVSERLGRNYKPVDTKLQSVNMVYPEKYLIGPGGGAIGIARNAAGLGIKGLNKAMSYIPAPVSGALNAYFGAEGIKEFADPNSLTRKSMSRAYDDPTGSNIGDAAFDVGMNSLNFVGLPFSKTFKGLKKYSKPLINSIDNTIYPTRTYSARLPGGNKTSYETSDLSKKIFKKGDWSTKSLDEARQYLSGSEATGRKGLLTGDDMIFTEYKVPFWKKNVSFDPDVVNLKNSQGVDINKGEFIIPHNKFLYPRKTTYIKAVPEHLKTAKTDLSIGDIEYSPSTIPLGPSSPQFASKPYKYIEDQINAASGHNMPLTYTYNSSLGHNQNIPLYNWQQPQFPINKRFKQGGATNDYVELDLTSEEIQKYKDGGYIVEEIDNYQDGGTVYTVKGSKGYYKKINGKWQVDWNRSGKYQPLSKGNIKARTAVLNKMAKPINDGMSKVSSNSSDNTRVNNIYQKPLDWSFDPKYKNNTQAFVKKSLEEKEKAIQKEKEDNKIKKGLANNEGIKETVGQYNRRKEKYDDLNLLGKMIENDPADNYKPQPVGRSPFEDSPMTGIGGAPKMILKAGKWLKPLLTGTKNATQPFRQATVSALKAPLPLGKTITNATAGTLTPKNLLFSYWAGESAYNQGDSNSDVRKSQSNLINNPSWNTLGDAAFETGVNSLGFSGLGLGKQVIKPVYNASKNVINNTYKVLGKNTKFFNSGEKPHWFKGYKQEWDPMLADLEPLSDFRTIQSGKNKGARTIWNDVEKKYRKMYYELETQKNAALKSNNKKLASDIDNKIQDIFYARKKEFQEIHNKNFKSKKHPFKESLGSGRFSTVYGLPKSEFTVKVGTIPEGEDVFKLVKNAKNIKKSNIAVPKKTYTTSSGENVIVMNKVDPIEGSIFLNPPTKKSYEQLLKDTEELKNKGLYLDFQNHNNIVYNPSTGLFNIYDLNTTGYLFRNNRLGKTYNSSKKTIEQILIDTGKLPKDWKQLPDSPNSINQSVIPTQSLISKFNNKIDNGAVILEQVFGKTLKGKSNKKAVDEGNEWLNNWINNPITQKKIDFDWKPYNSRTNFLKDELDLGYEQAKTFVPASKEYPLSNQFKELIKGRDNIHIDNKGVSYIHSDNPLFRIDLDPFSYKDIEKFPRTAGSWISRNPFMSQTQRASTTVHEGVHDWVTDFLLKNSGQKDNILKTLEPSSFEKLVKWKNKEKLSKEDEYIGYLANPTEVHARIMQLRKQFDMTPEESVQITSEIAQKIMNTVKRLPKKEQVVDPKFFDIIGNNPEKLAFLFRRLWGVVPVVGTAGLLNSKEKKHGGTSNDYVDVDLTPEEIKDLIAQGYVIEELN